MVHKYMSQKYKWLPFTVIDVSSLILNLVFLEGKEKFKEYLNNLQENKQRNRRETFVIAGNKNIADELGCFDDIYKYVNQYVLENNCKSQVVSDDMINDYIVYYTKTIVSHKTRFQRFLENYNCYSDSYDVKDGHKHKLYNLYTYLMQQFGNNIRSSGNPFNSEFVPNAYTKIARQIKYIIDIILRYKGEESVRICIDALRNPYEAFYLRDKYKAFYLISVNTEEKYRQEHLGNLKKPELSNLDDIEYSVDSSKRENVFFHQNVQACIEIADIHLHNDEETGSRYSLTEQIVKYIALMLHPGLVTPTAQERCMQLAYNAKLNSGCLSRQVGAVVTRYDYSVQGVGWNDVPKGQVSCIYRDIHDYCENKDSEMHSKHELEDKKFLSTMKYIDEILTLAKRDNNYNMCVPFCFKDVHEGITGQKNQVHTRALHAEENAFLQVSKYGGTGVKGGYLFTTASPCELCSKKAYQLGIKEIFYIDPYPGISKAHILTFGSQNNPKMTLFQGAIGEAYVSLYRPRIAIKDEAELITGIKIKDVAKCKPASDGVEFDDLVYKSSYLELEFKGNRTDVEVHRSSEVLILNDKIDSFIKNFEWTESTFDSINLDKTRSDDDVECIELPGEHPKYYKIKFGARGAKGTVKYGVIIKAKDEKKMMEQEVAYYSLFRTSHLELKLKAPKGIIKNAYRAVYADTDKKKLIYRHKIGEREVEASTVDDVITYRFKPHRVNVQYYYAIEWDFYEE